MLYGMLKISHYLNIFLSKWTLENILIHIFILNGIGIFTEEGIISFYLILGQIPNDSQFKRKIDS